MDKKFVEQLTAFSSPMILPLVEDPSKGQQNWVVRLMLDLPDNAIEEISTNLEAAARTAILNAHRESGAEDESVEPQISIKLGQIDQRHLVIGITTLRRDTTAVHSWLLSASAAMSALEKQFPIDDIQGIPRRFWTLLLGTLA